MQTNRWLPYTLTALLVLQPIARGQQPAPQPAEQPALTTVQSLRVIALAGNGEVNDMGRGIMAPLVIQVLDQNGRPVEGADVVFRFPVSGPSAIFADQKNSQATKTNADGQSAAVGWKANGQVGRYQVRVTATRGNEMGEVSITMVNAAQVSEEVKRPRRRWWSSPWAKVAIVAGVAGAVTAVVLATRGDDSAAPTITISPGSPSIGGPQ